MNEAIKYLNLKVEKDWKVKKYIKINWENLNKDVNVYWVPTKNCHLYLEYDNVVITFNKEGVIINKNNFIELPYNQDYYLLFLNKGYVDINKWLLKQNLPSYGNEAIIENSEWMEN